MGWVITNGRRLFYPRNFKMDYGSIGYVIDISVVQQNGEIVEIAISLKSEKRFM